MNPKYNIYEEIDRYLSHQLSEEELLDFQARLLQDEVLQETLEAQKIAHEIIIDHELMKLKDRIQKDLQPNDSGSSFQWSKIILLTAVLGSGAMYTYFQWDSKTQVTTPVKSISTPTPIDQNKTEHIQKGIRVEKQNHTLSQSMPTEDKNSVVFHNESNTLTEIINPHIEQHSNIIGEDKKDHILILERGDPEKTTVKTPVILSCDKTTISAEVVVNYGLDGFDEAQIVVKKSSLKGGTPPYTFALDESSFGKEDLFDGIKEGIHLVSIKDQNNCLFKKEVIIKTPQKVIDDAFAPSYGERWKFPLQQETEATITIFNKAGLTVYKNNIKGGYPDEWDGRDQNGNELDLGNYYFILTFKSNKMTKGNISILK